MNLAAVAVWIVLAIGPDGVALRSALVPEGIPEGAPLEALAETATALWLVVHHQPRWNRAFFLDADAEVASLQAQLGPEASDRARLLPTLRVPRLFLYQPQYQDEHGAFRLAVTLAVDVGEYLFAALLEAHLALLPASEPETETRITNRARMLMAEEPVANHVVAYRSALVAFGASALSVANEIARSQRRRRARGDSLCRLLDRPRSLMTHWRDAIIRDGAYPGIYQPGAGGPTVTTGAVLADEDKQFVATTLLGASWTGDPRHDFPWLCD